MKRRHISSQSQLSDLQVIQYILMLQIEHNCTFDRFQKFLFDEMDFNREGGMLDDENAGRNDRL